jgi:hypothetical protein
MKKSLVLTLGILIALVLVAVAFAGTATKLELKAGDEIYACNCGPECPCNTMARNPGMCTCGKDLVKAKVVQAEKGMVTLKGEGWKKDLTFKTQGKFACACGPECKCDTISQKAGKCTCGKDMKEVKETKKAG